MHIHKPSLIIKTYLKLGCPLQTAHELGISRSTVYRWLQRSRTWRGQHRIHVKRLSRRPHKTKRILQGYDISRIISLRKERGYTAEKIVHVLQLSCSSRTVHRCLKRHHLIRKTGKHRRPYQQPTVHMHAKNATTTGYLQMDVKYVTPQLSGLPWTCFEYAIIDIYSRYKEAIILNHLDQDGAIIALTEILPRLPFKCHFIQTDNGSEFQERFQGHCHSMGLKYHYIHKSSPNENAVIERSFRTDEEEFYFRMKRQPKHYDELRQWLADYLLFYNTQRPHLGIQLQTPQEAVANVLSD